MSVTKFVSQFVSNAVDRLVPLHCQLCGARAETGYELCDGCRVEMPWLVEACTCCALPLGGGNTGICGRCLSAAPDFDRLFALFRYENHVRDLILQMKFANKLASARLLGDLLAEALPYQFSPPDLIIPVPLHATRIRHRGYNQSLEIARVVARHWRVSLEPKRVRRTKATRTQSKLSASERAMNLRGVFEVRGVVEGKKVLLVDDVATTGTTLNELAKSLKKSGAIEVNAAVLARAT
ncbi:MAG: ComF family protein [bacterium]